MRVPKLTVGLNFLQSPSIIAHKKCSSGAANSWFKCIEPLFKQKFYFTPNNIFHSCGVTIEVFYKC